MKSKLLTFILWVSTDFPASHPRAGEKTNFPEKILNGTGKPFSVFGFDDLNPCINEVKIHTCRKNYPLWKARIEAILEGKAVLSIRYWKLKGGRYTRGNRQIEICQLDKNSGIGIQKIENATYSNRNIPEVWRIEDNYFNTNKICINDGLSLKDFQDWFQDYDLSKPLAIIHFTPYRY